MFDELKILITGDTAGLETAMKKALNVVQGGVGQMNAQEVDWTGIFERAVSPAIISSVASIFAFAIDQSMQFQTALNETGTAAGQSSAQIGQVGASSQQIAELTGQNATDIASAFAAITPIFADAATQLTFVADASQLAASGFGSLSDITQSSLPIMQMFGATTSQQVNDVLTELMHSAEGSGESFSAFAQQFMSVAPDLKAGGASLSDLNTILSGFSAEVANIGIDQASAAFATFGKVISGTNPALNALFGSSKALLDVVKNQGLPQALADMGEKIKASGQSANLLYTNFGLSTLAIDGLESSATQLPAVATDAQKIATNGQSIADAFNQSDSAARELSKDWQTFKTIMQDPAVATAAEDVAKALGDVLDAEKWIVDHASEVFTAIVNPFSTIGDILSKLPDLIGSIFNGSAMKSIENIFGNISSSVSSLLGTQTSGLNKALQGTGVGFSQSQLSGIDQKASSTGLVDSLVSALQSGIKSGQYTTLNSTFNLNVPQGSQGLTAKQIAQQLYNQFQGTQ
jgi:hypothetical protein